jgi:hypothetical protein
MPTICTYNQTLDVNQKNAKLIHYLVKMKENITKKISVHCTSLHHYVEG